MNLKVLIAEEKEGLRIDLHAILISDARVSEVSEAVNMRDLQSYLLSYTPDLIVVNQDLLAGLSIRQTENFVVLAEELDMTMLKMAYERGSCGYLSVNRPGELLRTVLSPIKGTFLLEPTFAPFVIEYVLDRICSPLDKTSGMTESERECICLLRANFAQSNTLRSFSPAETKLKSSIRKLICIATRIFSLGK